MLGRSLEAGAAPLVFYTQQFTPRPRGFMRARDEEANAFW
jgi:hypothetical protein